MKFYYRQLWNTLESIAPFIKVKHHLTQSGELKQYSPEFIIGFTLLEKGKKVYHIKGDYKGNYFLSIVLMYKRIRRHEVKTLEGGGVKYFNTSVKTSAASIA